MFKVVENSEILIQTGGVYKATQVWVDLKGRLFAKVGSGFIMLKENGSCSDNKTVIDHMCIDIPLCKDVFGRLVTEDFEGAKTLPEVNVKKLLALPDE